MFFIFLYKKAWIHIYLRLLFSQKIHNRKSILLVSYRSVTKIVIYMKRWVASNKFSLHATCIEASSNAKYTKYVDDKNNSCGLVISAHINIRNIYADNSAQNTSFLCVEYKAILISDLVTMWPGSETGVCDKVWTCGGLNYY